MSERCVSVPISWLELEQYHLGELATASMTRVGEHVATCSVCRGTLDSIEGDDRMLLELDTSPASAAENEGAFAPGEGSALGDADNVIPLARPSGESETSRWTRWAPLVALAAGVALVARAWSGHESRVVSPPEHDPSVKGGDVSFTLASDRHGLAEASVTQFEEGERFKVVLSCPPQLRAKFSVLVEEDDRTYFPLGGPKPVECGNVVVLPGAFTLTGREPKRVCVAWAAAHDDDRAAPSSMPPTTGKLCHVVTFADAGSDD